MPGSSFFWICFRGTGFQTVPLGWEGFLFRVVSGVQGFKQYRLVAQGPCGKTSTCGLCVPAASLSTCAVARLFGHPTGCFAKGRDRAVGHMCRVSSCMGACLRAGRGRGRVSFYRLALPCVRSVFGLDSFSMSGVRAVWAAGLRKGVTGLFGYVCKVSF